MHEYLNIYLSVCGGMLWRNATVPFQTHENHFINFHAFKTKHSFSKRSTERKIHFFECIWLNNHNCVLIFISWTLTKTNTNMFVWVVFDLDLINYISTLDFTKLSFKVISGVYVQEKPVDQPIHHVDNFPSLWKETPECLLTF